MLNTILLPKLHVEYSFVKIDMTSYARHACDEATQLVTNMCWQVKRRFEHTNHHQDAALRVLMNQWGDKYML